MFKLKRAVTAVTALVALSACTQQPSSAQVPPATADRQPAGVAQRPERPLPSNDHRRGMVYDGLRPGRRDGPCARGYQVGPETDGRRCSPGPDPAPEGIDVRQRRAATALAEETTARTAAEGRGSILCLGDGVGGNRVQAVYAVASDKADRFASVAPLIRQWAVATDGVFSASAAATGGDRHVRWVTNPDCTLSVLKVVLSPSGDDNMANTEAELASMGLNRSDRKYLVWTDANVYCGIAGLYVDDRPGADNPNNGAAPALVTRVDNGCWGLAESVEAHELMHNLGGVQPSAPHASAAYHCSDEADRMCYKDGPLVVLSATCPSGAEGQFDCGHDDYYSTAPSPGSYLATHWNTADSSFLTTTPPLTAAARYTALTPARILDTRSGQGAPAAAVGPGATVALTVTGRGGVPATGVSAVVMNVTVTQPSAPSYLTAWPAGQPRPTASNLNYLAGQTVPNLVVAKVGTGGGVSLYNAAGSTHVVADVVGWFGDE
ncbi:MAG: hypothetical protein M3N68_07425 [Actinomycetota bacterium]|nr:hypothetical protein [Actinomycetota bacterium]